VRALTVKQPWAWALVTGHKPIENRTWIPDVRNLGKHLVITSSKSKGEPHDNEAVWRMVPEFRPHMSRCGFVVGVVRLIGLLQIDEYDDVVDCIWWRGPGSSGLTWAQWCEANPRWREWATGPRCWVFDRASQLPEPIPCTGSLGLWMLPDAQLEELRKQWQPDG